MKNKLLLSSALVGGMIAGSSAIAQTSITGSLDIHYKAQEYSLSSGQGSKRDCQASSSKELQFSNPDLKWVPLNQLGRYGLPQPIKILLQGLSLARDDDLKN